MIFDLTSRVKLKVKNLFQSIPVLSSVQTVSSFCWTKAKLEIHMMVKLLSENMVKFSM